MRLVSLLRFLCCCGDTSAQSDVASAGSDSQGRSGSDTPSAGLSSDDVFEPREHHLTPYASDESMRIPIFFRAELSPQLSKLEPKALRKAVSTPVLPTSMG